MSSKADRFVEVEAYQTGSTWSVRTAFLKDHVGNYLGPCTDLNESEARALAGRWMEMQAKNRKQEAVTRLPAKKKGYLKEV